MLSDNQDQTKETFGFKWGKRDTYESEHLQAEWKRWLFEKYFDGDKEKLGELLDQASGPRGRARILDAGCGAGVSGRLLFGDHLLKHDYFGVDISNSVEVARQSFKEKGVPGSFHQSDLNNISIPGEQEDFDVIFSEGVLHHTDGVERAIRNLTTILRSGGAFLFYVYAKKAPIREYTDDLIRQYIANMSDEDAWEALESLTKFGKLLGDLDIEIEVEDPIPYLGIDKGKYNLQRLFYYKICKAYYRPDYSLDELNHINFDWFRPSNCFRHTPDEIQNFCTKAGLDVIRLHVEESGIAVIAIKE